MTRGILLAFVIAAAAGSSTASDGLLRTLGNRVETTNAIRAVVEVNSSYKALGTTSYEPVFDGKRFEVSIAAYADGDRFVMVHAERLIDRQGTLDYSRLAADALDGFRFTSRTQCAEIARDDVATEHDLKFLDDRGFDPTPAVAIKQFFATSADGNAEVVLTYGERVQACDASAEARLDQNARAAVKVLRLER